MNRTIIIIINWNSFVETICFSLNGWKDGKPTTQIPSAYKGILRIDEEPADTFILTKAWGKGVVFVNGFNIGRYHSIGPLHSLYIPAPLLRRGENSVLQMNIDA